jgi:oligopeptide/dipeptide ABC transporter ATP-binding protein
VRQISDRTAVMYRGRIVETGETETLFDDPVHPYTKLLIGSVPRLAGAGDAIEPDAVAAAEGGVEAAGENPMLAEITASAARGGTSPCRYADRCPAVVAACAVEPSLIADPRDSGRSAACVHVTERKGVVA